MFWGINEVMDDTRTPLNIKQNIDKTGGFGACKRRKKFREN